MEVSDGRTKISPLGESACRLGEGAAKFQASAAQSACACEFLREWLGAWALTG